MASKGSTLKAGESLKVNEQLQSENGRYVLRMQEDNNLVTYLIGDNTAEKPVWASGTYQKETVVLNMQTDGNLVLCKEHGEAFWSPSTEKGFDKKYGTDDWKPVRCVLENTGVLSLYSATGKRVWQNMNTGYLKVSSNFGNAAGGTTNQGLGTVDASNFFNNPKNKISLELIIDASGSMSENKMGYPTPSDPQITRIEVAKKTFGRVINEALPNNIPVALRVFGPGSLDIAGVKKDAEKVGIGVEGYTGLYKVLSPLDQTEKTKLLNIINSLKGEGRTPIAASIDRVKGDIGNTPGTKLVVLVTDGEENCGGDVSASIRKLAADPQFKLVLNIVGIQLSPDLEKTFTQLAKEGNGQFINVNDADKLYSTVSDALRLPYEIRWENTTAATGFVDGDKIELISDKAYDIYFTLTADSKDNSTMNGIAVAKDTTKTVTVNR